MIGGDVQGATMLSETMAQYSALMVMKHEYGADKMKKFLRYELDRYLHGRSGAKRAEMPLVRVENQPYIHYAKGSLVMYALQDYIGEDEVDAALAKFVAKNKFQGPPYTDAPAFVAALREATPPEYPHLIAGSLRDDHALREPRYARDIREARGREVRRRRSTCTRRSSARTTSASRRRSRSTISSTSASSTRTGRCSRSSARRSTRAMRRFTLTVDTEPAKAGIDPLNKLIDRMPDDNVMKVEKKESDDALLYRTASACLT